MLELEKKYLNKLNLKYEIGNRHINMSCPICGEGNSPYKKRGYVYIDSDNTPFYMCYNSCGGMSYYQFLEYQDETLAKEYYKETIKTKFKERNTNKEVFKKKSKIKTEKFDGKFIEIILKEKKKKLKLVPIEVSKQAKDFIKSRGFTLQEIKQYGFYYNKELNAIVHPLYINSKKDEITGVQIRLIDEKRFINYMYEENHKVWHEDLLQTLHYGSDVFVFESIFDLLSTNIKNSISALGSDISEEFIRYYDKYRFIFVFDSDEVGTSKALKYSNKGYDVLVHKPNSNKYFKDFNEMLQKGISKEKITKYILSNIKSPKMSNLKTRLKRNYELFDWN